MGKREEEGIGHLEKGQKMWGPCISSHIDSLGLNSLVSKIRIKRTIVCPWGDCRYHRS